MIKSISQNPYVSTMIGNTAEGSALGLGYGVYNKMYGTSTYGSNYNDPYIGYADYVIHGAGMGAMAGFAMAGLQYQAHQKKLSHLSENTRQMLQMLGGG